MLDKLPTDNLYKFVALCGVALLGLGLYSQNQRSQVTMEIYEINRVYWLPDIGARIEAARGEALDRVEGRPPPDPEVVDRREERYLREDERSAVGAEKRLAALKTIPLSKENEQRSIVIGLLLSVLGGWLWYRRTQRAQDAAVAPRVPVLRIPR